MEHDLVVSSIGYGLFLVESLPKSVGSVLGEFCRPHTNDTESHTCMHWEDNSTTSFSSSSCCCRSTILECSISLTELTRSSWRIWTRVFANAIMSDSILDNDNSMSLYNLLVSFDLFAYSYVIRSNQTVNHQHAILVCWLMTRSHGLTLVYNRWWFVLTRSASSNLAFPLFMSMRHDEAIKRTRSLWRRLQSKRISDE